MQMNIDIESSRERKKLAWEGLFYSNRRIDLLVVSISGAGIYLCFETMKYLKEDAIDIHWLIKACGVVFLLAIVANFISQLYGRSANSEDYLMCQSEIDAANEDDKEERGRLAGMADCHDDKSEGLSNKCERAGLVSMALMGLGLSGIVYYFTIIF